MGKLKPPRVVDIYVRCTEQWRKDKPRSADSSSKVNTDRRIYYLWWNYREFEVLNRAAL